jgi:hypothetical protein
MAEAFVENSPPDEPIDPWSVVVEIGILARMSGSSSGLRPALGGVLLVLTGAAYILVTSVNWFFAALNGSEALGGDGTYDKTGVLLTMAGLGLLVVGSGAVASGRAGAWKAGMTIAVLNGLAALVMVSPATLGYLVVIATMLVARAEAYLE